MVTFTRAHFHLPVAAFVLMSAFPRAVGGNGALGTIRTLRLPSRRSTVKAARNAASQTELGCEVARRSRRRDRRGELGCFASLEVVAMPYS